MVSNFYEEIYKLKKLVRTGWIETVHGTNRLESDAEHCFSCCMLALKIINEKKLKLNQEKVLKMLMFHELGEIDVGDIPANSGYPLKDKYDKEKRGVERIAKKFKMPEMLELWEEFESFETPESRFCKMIDKLDTIMQANEYSMETQNAEIFEEFYNTSKSRIEGYEEYLNKQKK